MPSDIHHFIGWLFVVRNNLPQNSEGRLELCSHTGAYLWCATRQRCCGIIDKNHRNFIVIIVRNPPDVFRISGTTAEPCLILRP